MDVSEPEREPVAREVVPGTPDRLVAGSGCVPQAQDRATPSGPAGNLRAAHRMIDTRAPAGSQSR